MAPELDPPDPPSLPEVDADAYDDVEVQGEEYRREEIEELLEAGAWEDAFDEWAAHTDLDPEDHRIALELGLFDEFDFFWDGFAERVGYHAPGIPEDWRERGLHPGLDSWDTVSGINAALAEFGDTVSRTLTEDYVDWEGDYEAPDDLPDF